ncbi:MAG: hypothetical protein JWO18_1140 [Microbacteriaceae bacterium]|nr:hypothetical protein [Microbacteriaceae bacterium]
MSSLLAHTITAPVLEAIQMWLQEVASLDFQRISEPVDVVEADVPFASLHTSDISAMDVDAVCQRLLAKAKAFSK